MPIKVLQNLRRYMQRPLVRPWALAGPVIVLMLCLPLLRPLRQPDTRQWSDREQLTTSTIQALVEQHSLAIDKTVFGDNPAAVRHEDGALYSPYSPMYPVLLAPIYWVLLKQGLDYSDNLIFVQYLMVLIGSAIPAAMSVGMVYRLARVFELRRSMRVVVGLAAIMGGGLISYAVVLSPHTLAAYLLLIAVTLISHLAVTAHPYREVGLALVAGMMAAVAVAIDPPAATVAVLLCLVLLAMRWSRSFRVGAVILYVAGAVPVVAVQLLLMHAAGGAVVASPRVMQVFEPASVTAVMNPTARELMSDAADDTDGAPTRIEVAWNYVAGGIGRILEGLLGEHGLLSHFPVLIIGVLGSMLVLHRNWTATTKMLAVVPLGATLLLVIIYAWSEHGVARSYGAPWYVCVSPIVLLWGGAWIRRPHRPQSWVLAGAVLAFSVAVGVVGMSNPEPQGGYRGYTFAQASMNLFADPAQKSARDAK